MTLAIACAAILGALVFALGFNVSRLRGTKAEEGPLHIAIRAHGNAAEYVPTFMVLFLLVGWRAAGLWGAVLIVGATLSRLAHATGMVASQNTLRQLGAFGTYGFGLALAVTVVISLW